MKSKSLRKFSLNKKLAGIVVAVLVVFAAALFGSVLYGRATLNTALSRINSDESERFEYLIKNAETDNAITNNSSQITFGGDFDYDKNLSLINENDGLVNSLMDSRKEDCVRQAGRFKVALNIFARIADKEKHDGIVEAIQLMPVHSDDYCQYIEGLRSYNLFINDMDRAINAITQVAASNSQDVAAAKSLAKFSNGTYEVSNMEMIKTVYGDAYEAAINERIRARGLFYEYYTAARAGNAALANSTRQELIIVDKKATEFEDSARAARGLKDKANNAKVLQADIRLYNLLTEINESSPGTQFSNSVWAANVLVSSLRSYRHDNMDKYPKAANTGELVRILKEHGHLDGVELKLDGVTYSATQDTSYALSFKNEITGKEYTFKHEGY